MHPEESPLCRIGGATLNNGDFFPDSDGARPDRLLPGHNESGNTISCQQGSGGTPVMGTATLQRQFSTDEGVSWVNDGAAVATAAFVAVTLFRRYRYRWQVTGSGSATGTGFVIG